MTDFWQGRKVFVTSPASFRGSWLCLHLLKLGAQVSGYGPLPERSPHLFDIENLGQKVGMTVGELGGSVSNQQGLLEALNRSESEIVIHLGCEYSLKSTRENPVGYFDAEVMGTASLMEALRQTASVRAILVVSSDKVYPRRAEVFDETHPVAVGEISPTGKLCAEFVALSFREQFFTPEKFNKHKISVGVARVGSAVAGGDLSEDSLVFQAIESFIAGRPFQVKKPGSVRTWIDMQDQIEGLLAVAQHLYEQGPKAEKIFNIAGNQQARVEDFVQLLEKTWSGQVAKGASSAKDSLHPVLSSEKVKAVLGWVPKLTLESSAQKIVDWYRMFYS